MNRIWRDLALVAAIEVASPALAGRVEELRVSPDPCPRALRRASLSVLRYVLRATSRATPFGLFAGVAPLHVGESSRVVLGAEHKAVARVDHRWVDGVGQRLQGCPSLAGRWVVAVDGRVVTRGGRLVLPSRPSQHATERGSDANPAEVSVRLSAPVAAVLRYAATPIALDDLRDRLSGQFPTASVGGVRQLLSGLVAQGFLVTALPPPMTTVDPLSHLIGTAAAAGADRDPDAAPILADLRSITGLLGNHASQPDPLMRRQLRADAVSRMRAVVGGESPLGFDLRVDAQVTVPHDVTTEAAAAAAALVRLAPDLAGSVQWRDYHRRFLDRYGIGAVVPLPPSAGRCPSVAVHRTERRCGEGGEHPWPVGDRGGDALGAAGQTSSQEVEGVGCVAVRAGRAHGVSAVAARGEHVATGRGEHLAGGGVGDGPGAGEVDGLQAAADGFDLGPPGAVVTGAQPVGHAVIQGGGDRTHHEHTSTGEATEPERGRPGREGTAKPRPEPRPGRLVNGECGSGRDGVPVELLAGGQLGGELCGHHRGPRHGGPRELGEHSQHLHHHPAGGRPRPATSSTGRNSPIRGGSPTTARP